jgi:hypothetical protein
VTVRRTIGFLLAARVLLACSSGSSSGTPSTVGSSEVCAKVAALPCSEYTNQADCESALEKSRQHAAQAGCSAEYEAAVSCTVDHPPTCGSSGELVASQECTQAGLAYAKCDPSGICTRSSSTDTCTYGCSDAAMSCDQQNAGWTCTCTKGPKLNQSFTTTELAPCGHALLAANCE